MPTNCPTRPSAGSQRTNRTRRFTNWRQTYENPIRDPAHHRKPSRSEKAPGLVGFDRRRDLALLLTALKEKLVCKFARLPAPLASAWFFSLTTLVSNQLDRHIPTTDPLLVSAWGLARSATSPWWSAITSPSNKSRRNT
jgi:hypothetical protein